MSLKRIMVWVTICAFLFTRVSVFAQSSHGQGVTAGIHRKGESDG